MKVTGVKSWVKSLVLFLIVVILCVFAITLVGLNKRVSTLELNPVTIVKFPPSEPTASPSATPTIKVFRTTIAPKTSIVPSDK